MPQINAPNPVYSFLDVSCTIVGPGGSISLGAGSANAEEGISVEFTEDKDRLAFGADGSPMHSLIAALGGKFMVRLQKVSPVNSLLVAMYNVQKVSSGLWGKNTIVLNNAVSGDNYTGTSAAFTKIPRNDYASAAGNLEWDFNVGVMEVVLGSGVPL